MKNLLSKPLMLLLVLASSSAIANVELSISPADPTPHDEVFLQLTGTSPTVVFSDQRSYFVTRTDSSISVLVVLGLSQNDNPVPIQTMYSLSLGTFDPGDYSVEVSFSQQSINRPPTQSLGFEVSAFPVPSLGLLGILVLVIVLAIIGLKSAEHMRCVAGALFLLLIYPPSNYSQESTQNQDLEKTAFAVFRLKEMSEGAPSPRDVMDDFARGQGLPILGLGVNRPLSLSPILRELVGGRSGEAIGRRPMSALARLNRSFVVEFPNIQSRQEAIMSLRRNSLIDIAGEVPETYRFSNDAKSASEPQGSPKGTVDPLRLDGMLSLTPGHGRVFALDTGLDTDHPSLSPTNPSGQFQGGPFLGAWSEDFGNPTPDPFNVDERKLHPSDDFFCQQNGGMKNPRKTTGHGTHVAGLISSSSGHGGCDGCGIGMLRIAQTTDCVFDANEGHVGVSAIQPIAIPQAVTRASERPSQVVNMSFGTPYEIQAKPEDEIDPCEDPTPAGANAFDVITCDSITLLIERDIIVVASAGNNGALLNFPARDIRVVSAGGLDEDNDLWVEPLQTDGKCPGPLDDVCGSNIGSSSSLMDIENGKFFFLGTELMAPAKSVISTFYDDPDGPTSWVADPVVPCNETDDGNPTDLLGTCTGTSMSAPLISGMFAALRSINPLTQATLLTDTTYGVRDLVVRTTQEATATGTGVYNDAFGYGIPNAELAARRMLGTVGGQQVRNRATPLFELREPDGSKDTAQSTSPQFMGSLIIADDVGNYTLSPPDEDPNNAFDVDSYLAYPLYVGMESPPPRTRVYVLTTPHDPVVANASLETIYQVGRNQPGTSNPLDYTLTTSRDIQYFLDSGYDYLGIEGYIYPPSANRPDTENLLRQCRGSAGECAIFLDIDSQEYVDLGYTSARPPGSSPIIGKAYPHVDSDDDGLIDGFENFLGLDPMSANSDGDLMPDRLEFPANGISRSDPFDMEPPIFASGFEVDPQKDFFGALDIPVFIAAEFESAGEYDGWSATANISHFYVNPNGKLVVKSTSADPIMKTEPLSFPGNKASRMSVRYRSPTHNNTVMQMYWATDSQNFFHSSRLISLPYNGNGQWRTLTFDLSTHPQWETEQIARIRIDPMNASGATGMIDWIRID